MIILHFCRFTQYFLTNTYNLFSVFCCPESLATNEVRIWVASSRVQERLATITVDEAQQIWQW